MIMVFQAIMSRYLCILLCYCLYSSVELLLGPRASPPGLVEAAQGMATNPQVGRLKPPLSVQ